MLQVHPASGQIDGFDKQVYLGESRMHIKAILNRVLNYKGFVFSEFRLVEGEQRVLQLEIRIRPRAGTRGECEECGRRSWCYDTLAERRFEFIPMWGLLVFFVYARRRVNCRQCGVRVERIPWCEGKHQLTTEYSWFLARWAKRLSWSDVASAFHTTWYHVFASVEMAVEWGRAHMVLDGVTAIGIDEMQWGRGHRYVTVVYQINEACKRLLWVGEDRKESTVCAFFNWLTPQRSALLQFVASDMWQPYLKVIAQKAGQALHILDRFHIVGHLGKALDKVRADEARQMRAEGREPVLKHSRWPLLKRVENMTERQIDKLTDLLRYNLKTVRAWIMKDDFDRFWSYSSAHWAGVFLDQWCTRAMRSRLEPMKRVARMLRHHRPLILNWFRAKKEFSCGVVEGLNGKAKVVTKRAYGFGSFHALEIALYHTLGKLPEPKVTHEFF